MMGDICIIGDTTVRYAPCVPYVYADPIPCPPPNGYRIRACCDRWGHGTYLVPLDRPPMSLGTRAQCPSRSRRSVRELQIKSWI